MQPNATMDIANYITYYYTFQINALISVLGINVLIY